MGEFAGNLPQTLVKFRCSEKKSKWQGWSQTEEAQQLVISPPSAVAETMEVPQTDTTPVRTMTALQRAQSGTDISKGVCWTNVDPMGSVQSDGL